MLDAMIVFLHRKNNSKTITHREYQFVIEQILIFK